MHNNFHFLRLLVKSLNTRLERTVVSECFSQSRDELMIRFETSGKSFFIKADVRPEFSCLSFPDAFNRARKNSADLFEPLIGQRVLEVMIFRHERSFMIRFTGNISLLFKLHGNRSNLVLLKDEKPVALFRNNLQNDWNIRPAELHRSIDWSEQAFVQNLHQLKTYYFTLGKIVWAYLEQQGFENASADDKWRMMRQLLQLLEKPELYIITYQGTLHFSLLPLGTTEYRSTDPIAALNEFYHRYNAITSTEKRRQQAINTLSGQIRNAYAYIRKNEALLAALQQDNHYKHWADLIMANLHLVPPGSKHVSLPDFYRKNTSVDIKLNASLSAQKNAEVFYRKARNQHIEKKKLEEGILQKKQLIEQLEEKLQLLESARDPKSVQKVLQSVQRQQSLKPEQNNLPYHEVEYMGYRIWIGKSAQRNDELTLKYGYKEDLWLHAKDVPGSHVLVKYQPGKNFPRPVIERAAQLAAYHSKRKTDTLCPVVVTPKKYVRKRKGDPPGSVIVDKETVIMVEPKPA